MIDFGNQEPDLSYSDTSFEFPESIHWTELPDAETNISADIENISWERIKSVYGVDKFSLWGSKGIEPQDAIQGQMGNCWLITAAISMAESLPRISNMFEIQQINSASIYAAQMYLLGMPITVIVDDYLPLDAYEENLTLYAKISEDSGLWGTLYEKFFAKFFGNYEMIDAG